MKKILLLTGNIFPCHAGDSIFTAGLAERLSNQFFIDILTFGDEQKICNDSVFLRMKHRFNKFVIVDSKLSMRDIFRNVIRYGTIQSNNRGMRECLNRVLSDTIYDYIICDHLRMYSLILETNHLINSAKTKLIFMAHNTEYENVEQEISYEHSCYKKCKARILNYRIKQFEQKAIRNADYLWGVCLEDIEKLMQLAHDNDKKYEIIPPFFNYHQVKTTKSILNPSYNLLFLGSMSWYPNVHGVIYFIENVFNKLFREDSRYRLYVVGKNPHSSLLKYQSDHIIITGGVESVDRYIEQCDFVVIPNRLGTGVKIKILESVLKGIPVITFVENTQGYPSELFQGGFSVETDSDFLTNIVRLNASGDSKVSFINNARQLLYKKNMKLSLSIF